MNAQQPGKYGLGGPIGLDEPLELLDVHGWTFKTEIALIANAIIATFRLKWNCDYRMMRFMQRLTDAAMAALGGTTAVAALLKAPVSTVHSWKRSGISESRLDHLKLAAQAAGKQIDWTAALEDLPDADEPEQAAA